MEPKFVGLPGNQGVNLALIVSWAVGPHPDEVGAWSLAVRFISDEKETHFSGVVANRLLAILNELAQPIMGDEWLAKEDEQPSKEV